MVWNHDPVGGDLQLSRAASIELSQWKYIVGFMAEIPYEIHRKAEYAVIYLVPATGAQMVMSLLHYQPPRWVRIYQFGFPVLALAATLIPGTGALAHTLFFWQVYTVPLMFAGLVLVIWYSVQGNVEARTMLVGWAVFLYAAINDILLAQGILQTPRLLPLGFAAVLVSMAISLANRFTRIHNHLDGLVKERTASRVSTTNTDMPVAITRCGELLTCSAISCAMWTPWRAGAERSLFFCCRRLL